jgi:hypothetical protein
MKYSIQDPYGEVYGEYPVPDTDKSPEQLSRELSTELADILGINGVESSPLPGPRTHIQEDRVVIDIEPTRDAKERDARLARVHRAIGKLAIRRQGSGRIRLVRPED